MTRTSGGGSVILVALVLVGCVADQPPQHPPPAPHRPPAATAAPVKQQVREIKTTIGKLRRKLEKRERLAPLDPPT